MLTKCLAVFFISFLIGVLSLVLFKKLALKYNRLVLNGVPLVGGLSMAAAFIAGIAASCLIFKVIPRQLSGIAVSSLIMLVFGLFDDRRELSIRTKFLAQIIATSVLILSGVRTKIVYMSDLTNMLITLVWVIGITNAFNHLDIMDGLAGGVGFIVAAAFLAVSLLNQDITSLILVMAVISAVSSFLVDNLPPAKTYMGNSGSHFLGFLLASVAMLISYAPMGRKIALLSPILILGLPIFDTVFVSIVRLKKHIWPFKKSADHLALLLLRSGYSKRRVLAYMFFLTLLFCISGITLMKIPNSLGALLVSAVAVMSLVLIVKMGKLGR